MAIYLTLQEGPTPNESRVLLASSDPLLIDLVRRELSSRLAAGCGDFAPELPPRRAGDPARWPRDARSWMPPRPIPTGSAPCNPHCSTCQRAFQTGNARQSTTRRNRRSMWRRSSTSTRRGLPAPPAASTRDGNWRGSGPGTYPSTVSEAEFVCTHDPALADRVV